MNDYFCPRMERSDINNISMLGLAHIGDGVYELLTRTMLCADGKHKSDRAAQKNGCDSECSGSGRASAGRGFRRCLTTTKCMSTSAAATQKVNSVPHKADIAQYHAATGLEALFGWLYLQGKTQRINELYAVCVEGHHGA